MHYKFSSERYTTAVQTCLILVVWCLLVAPQSLAFAQPAQPTRAQRTPVEQAFKEAASRQSPLPLEALLYAAGMSSEDRAMNHRMMERVIDAIGTRPDDITFDWQPFARDTLSTAPTITLSCRPLYQLEVSRKSMPGQTARVHFCEEHGALVRMGYIRVPRD